jgi:hypothetical protein
MVFGLFESTATVQQLGIEFVDVPEIRDGRESMRDVGERDVTLNGADDTPIADAAQQQAVSVPVTGFSPIGVRWFLRRIRDLRGPRSASPRSRTSYRSPR